MWTGGEVGMKKVNINSLVTIELLPLGENILHDEFEKITKEYPGLNIEFKDAYRIKDHKAEMELWHVMNHFGKYMYNGAVEQPIKLDICIKDSDLIPEERCNMCKFYEGVHGCQGHAPCSMWGSGGVLWNEYCSRFEKSSDLT